MIKATIPDPPRHFADPLCLNAIIEQADRYAEINNRFGQVGKRAFYDGVMYVLQLQNKPIKQKQYGTN